VLDPKPRHPRPSTLPSANRDGSLPRPGLPATTVDFVACSFRQRSFALRVVSIDRSKRSHIPAVGFGFRAIRYRLAV
jgi:hypothetical protein